MRIPTVASIVLVLLAGFVPSAIAQVIEGQPRPVGSRFRPRTVLDPNRVSQELLVALSLSGGYDDNLIPEAAPVPTDRFTLQDQGYVGAGAATMQYRLGTSTRNLEGLGHAYVNRGATMVGPPAGGDVSLAATTSLGRRMGATLGLGTTYEPTTLFNALGGISPQVEGGEGLDEVLEVTPTQAITPQRWLSVQATAGFYRNWTSRQRMNIQYGTGRRQPLTGPKQDTRLQYASVSHSWDPRQNAGFLFSYRFNEHRQDVLISDEPVRTNAVDFGMRLDRRLSQTRSMGFTFGGGATKTSSQPFEGIPQREFTLPTAYGSARINILRDWSLGVDARRDVSVLDGLAPEPFATIATTVSLEGEVGSKLQLGVSWASSRGDTQSRSSSAFATATGTAQIQYALTRTGGIFLGFTHYEHQQEGVLPLQTALPRRYNRNSIRLGVTFWLPIMGGS